MKFPVVANIYSRLTVAGFILVLLTCAANTYAASDNGASYRNLPDGLQYVPAEMVKRAANPNELRLKSHVALVYDERDDVVLYQRGASQKKPIASLTKLMTAMVIIDANLDMDEIITVSREDKDTIRYSKTKLAVGSALRRRDLLLMALAASENRAALALSRTYPGGTEQFIEKMNEKAKFLGLSYSRFADAAGLSNANVSTAEDMLKMVRVANQYSLIREYTTTAKDLVVDEESGKIIRFSNTNRLVRNDSWDISISKTGFTSDAGNCLVMKLTIDNRPLVLVLLNSWGKLSKYGDVNRIRRWIANAENRARRLKLF